MPNQTIEPGLYRHYQGNLYRVLYTARHTETGELVAVYMEEGAPNRMYVRPASMWFDQVGVDKAGQPITRFTRCE